MITTHGEERRKKLGKLLVGDADSLIALVFKGDANNPKAEDISRMIAAEGYDLIYPVTALTEAITTLKRSMSLTREAHFLNSQYQKGVFNVQYVDEEIVLSASKIFEKTVSKKNTIFDAIVAATAEKLEADAIFSFDDWYPKLGFKLAGDLVDTKS